LPRGCRSVRNPELGNLAFTFCFHNNCVLQERSRESPQPHTGLGYPDTLSTPHVDVRLTSSRQRRSKLKCSITKVNFSTHTNWWGKEGRPSASHLHTRTRAAARGVPGAPHGIHVYGPVTLSRTLRLLQHVCVKTGKQPTTKEFARRAPRPARPRTTPRRIRKCLWSVSTYNAA